MYCLWFNRFIVGCHNRMGDDIRPDKAMSIELLLEIQRLYEIKLFACGTHEVVLEVCLNAVFHIVSFVGGFQGEELPTTSLDAVAKFLTIPQPRDPHLAHVMITLRGRIKGESKDHSCHLIPLAATTKTGL